MPTSKSALPSHLQANRFTSTLPRLQHFTAHISRSIALSAPIPHVTVKPPLAKLQGGKCNVDMWSPFVFAVARSPDSTEVDPQSLPLVHCLPLAFTDTPRADCTDRPFVLARPFASPHWLARARSLGGHNASHTRHIWFYSHQHRRQNYHEETLERPPENHHLGISSHHHHITSARMRMHLAHMRAQLASTQRPQRGLAAARVVRTPLPENSQKVCQ